MTITPSILHPENNLALPMAVVVVVIVVSPPSLQSAVHLNVSVVSAIQDEDPSPASSFSLSSSFPSSSVDIFPATVAVVAAVVMFPPQAWDGCTCTPRGLPPCRRCCHHCQCCRSRRGAVASGVAVPCAPTPAVNDVDANATAGNCGEDNSNKMVAMTMPMTA